MKAHFGSWSTFTSLHCKNSAPGGNQNDAAVKDRAEASLVEPKNLSSLAKERQDVVANEMQDVRSPESVSVPAANESVTGESDRCADCHQYVPPEHPLSLAHHAASCPKLPQRTRGSSLPHSASALPVAATKLNTTPSTMQEWEERLLRMLCEKPRLHLGSDIGTKCPLPKSEQGPGRITDAVKARPMAVPHRGSLRSE